MEKRQIRYIKNKENIRYKDLERYKTMDSDKKQELLDKKAEQHKNMDSDKKQELLDKKAEQYKTLDSDKKQQLLNKKAEQYKAMNTAKKQEVLAKHKEKYSSSKNKTVDSCIEDFRRKIQEGPYYICCICNKSLYKKSVSKLTRSAYPSKDVFNVVLSFNGKEYICKNCHSKAIDGRIPCQAIKNNLYVDNIPTELEDLKKLEQIIIAPHCI